MSIIYDALKKVENKVSKPGAKNLTSIAPKVISFTPKKKIPKILISVLAICLLVFVAKIFFKAPPKPLPESPPPVVEQLPVPPEPAQEAAPEVKEPGPFVLNGVFFSGSEGYALINGQVVKKGDEIEGAIVTGIALDEVDLEVEGSVIKLPNNMR